MSFELLPLDNEHIETFKRDMQEAFQKGAQAHFADLNEEILPEKDINDSLGAKGSAAYMAVINGEIMGGAVVIINSETQYNHLDFLYVKYGCQSSGTGYKIWTELEKLYPDTKVWATCTPYFEKRNIHFYINKCGFHAVEFFNRYHIDPHQPQNDESLPDNDYFEGMFNFEKNMK